MFPTKFWFIWLSSFREEDFQKSTNQKQALPMAVMFIYGSKRNEQSPQMLPIKFRFIWQSGFRGEDFQKSTNQKQELPVVAMFVNGSARKEHSSQRTFHRCFLPSFGSFGKTVSEQKSFKYQPIRNKNCLWQPCLLMDQEKMRKGPPIDATYQASVHLAKRFQRRRFLEIDHSETRIACGGHVC